MIPKVLAYIIRDAAPEPQVLVFTSVDQPDEAPQVPGGGAHEGEDLLSALRREILEETGISNATIAGQVAKAPFHAQWRNEWQERNVFHVVAPAGLPDRWTHLVTDGDEDKGKEVSLRWLSLSDAKACLHWGQGQWLDSINKTIQGN